MRFAFRRLLNRHSLVQLNNLKNAVRENGENNAEEKRVIFNYGVKYSLHVQLPDIARLYMVFQLLFSVFRKKIL